MLLTCLDLSGNKALGPDCTLLVTAAIRANHLQRLLLVDTGTSSPLGSLISGLRQLKDPAHRLHCPSPLQLLDLSHNNINSSDRAALLTVWQELWPEQSPQLDSTHEWSCTITAARL